MVIWSRKMAPGSGLLWKQTGILVPLPRPPSQAELEQISLRGCPGGVGVAGLEGFGLTARNLQGLSCWAWAPEVCLRRWHNRGWGARTGQSMGPAPALPVFLNFRIEFLPSLPEGDLHSVYLEASLHHCGLPVKVHQHNWRRYIYFIISWAQHMCWIVHKVKNELSSWLNFYTFIGRFALRKAGVIPKLQKQALKG